MCTVETHMANIFVAKAHNKRPSHRTQEASVARHKGSGYSANLFVALSDMATMHTALKNEEGTYFPEQAYNLACLERSILLSRVQR
jgi:hypothetical protein